MPLQIRLLLYPIILPTLILCPYWLGNTESIATGGLLNHHVVLSGLMNRADLNGRHGFVSSWDPSRDRYTVRMEGSRNEEDWKLKPANLRLWVLGAVEDDTSAAARAEVTRIQVPSTLLPQPVDPDVALQIALVVREWELESPRAYHCVKDESNKDDSGLYSKFLFDEDFDELSMEKPHKFVAVLSHNYTPDALRDGMHALKGRDRILANLLDAARRVDPAHDRRLASLAAETLLRTAGAEAMNNLGQTQYDVLLGSLNCRSGTASTTTNAGVVETGLVEEPYTFDVFLTMLTGVECGDFDDTQQGCFTTGALIPLLSGDPDVFQTLLDAKAGNSPSCWYPTSFDGMEIADAFHLLAQQDANEPDSDRLYRSLNEAGLFDPDTWRHDPGFDNPDDEAWNDWKRNNGMEPDDLCDPYAFQDINDGDLHIGLNELLLTDVDCYEDQQTAAIICTSESGKCGCNEVQDFPCIQHYTLTNPKKLEFTGNSLVDYPGRWYSRAALVFWPHSHRSALMSKAKL